MSVRKLIESIAAHAIYSTWQCLPIDFASSFGCFVAKRLAPRFHRTTNATRVTLKKLQPELTDEELDDILVTMWCNIGRVWSEAVITRRIAAARLEIVDAEAFHLATATDGPLICPFIHLGNWELIAHAFVQDTRAVYIPVEVLKQRLFNEMATRVRSSTGCRIIQPTISGTREIYRCLENGDTLGLAIDEYKDGQVLGPDFGRRPRKTSNLDYLLRLAARYKATIIPAYVKRTAFAQFELRFAPPIFKEEFEDDSGSMAVRAKLSDWSHKAIINNLDQWYMLHRLRL